MFWPFLFTEFHQRMVASSMHFGYQMSKLGIVIAKGISVEKISMVQCVRAVPVHMRA